MAGAFFQNILYTPVRTVHVAHPCFHAVPLLQDGDDPLRYRVHGLHGLRHNGQARREHSFLRGHCVLSTAKIAYAVK
jgi:hypothetical protein